MGKANTTHVETPAEVVHTLDISVTLEVGDEVIVSPDARYVGEFRGKLCRIVAFDKGPSDSRLGLIVEKVSPPPGYLPRQVLVWVSEVAVPLTEPN